MRSEVRIVAELAAALFAGDASGEFPLPWRALADDYASIRDRIARVVPGFGDFNRRIAADGGIVLPHAVRDACRFATPCGRALFTVHPLPVPPRAGDRYLMTTIRSHDQFNTTVYSDDDRYRGIAGSRRVVFVNAADVRDAGLEPGEAVDIVSEWAGEERTVPGFRVVPYDIPAGCVATYYPEANGLVPIGHVAERSNTPAYKSVQVRLVPRGVDSR
jgi:anaerobic selenocysteine-containing dehydrogenase